MAAPTNLIFLLRTVLQDIAVTTEYSDADLSRTIVAAAIFVKAEVKLNNTYAINISAETISPDPTEYPTVDEPDDNYTMLIIYKAACIIAQGELKKSAAKNVVIVDGPDKFDNSGGTNSYKASADNICQAYKDAKLQYSAGTLPGHAVMGPIRIGYYNTLPPGWYSPKRWC